MGPIRGLRGEQIVATDDGCDDARSIFNAMVDRRPALIARCTEPDDVCSRSLTRGSSGCPSRSGPAATPSPARVSTTAAW